MGLSFSRLNLFVSHKTLPGYALTKARHPEVFQGNRKTKKYFEGWYFKMVSSDSSSILSVIPGIALSPDGTEKHAFIQLIDGKTAQTSYYTFPIEEFSFSSKEFAISIGKNYFSQDKIILDIYSDGSTLSGEIHISEQVRLPGHFLLNSGIMGWYRFVPFMQCYHGVVSITNGLEGSITIDKKSYNFAKGKGYIEKDWGSSMPSSWIWMQTNSFGKENCSFMLSVANIPWLGSSFTGFLGFFLLDSTIYRFATYTNAKLKIVKLEQNTVVIKITDSKYIYDIEAVRNNAGLLRAPVKGLMDRRIGESVDAIIKLSIQDKSGNIIFNDSTSVAGLEIVNGEELIN